jgi:intergrase/recombinase
MFELLGDKGVLKEYKYKSVMPSFNVRTPSLEEVVIFDKNIKNEQVRLFYRLAIVSGIRPEHITRLTKGLIDTKTRTINTWLKTYSKKNFFISYYTQDLAPQLEEHLKTLKTPETPLFDITNRGIQKEFRKTVARCGVQITPKTCRKFLTNWVRRHGMIREDVDALTSHLPQSIVARHYLDIFENLKDEYDKATKDLHFFEASEPRHKPPLF